MQDGNMGNVIFTGILTREEIRDVYQKTKVALFPVHSQGSWLSPFEAVSAGCKIVVSKEATCSDFISSCSIGEVCETLEQYVEAIISPDWKKELDDLKELTWDKFSERVLEEMR
jgi:glycosyltransferase involved in cell wall biosynthesis